MAQDRGDTVETNITPEQEVQFVFQKLVTNKSPMDEVSGQGYSPLSRIARRVGDPQNKLDPALAFLSASEAIQRIRQITVNSSEYKRNIQDAINGRLPNLRVFDNDVINAVHKIQTLRSGAETNRKDWESLDNLRHLGHSIIESYK